MPNKRILLILFCASLFGPLAHATVQEAPASRIRCETLTYISDSAAVEFDRRGMLLHHDFESGVDQFVLRPGEGQVLIDYLKQRLNEIPKFRTVQPLFELIETTEDGTNTDNRPADAVFWFYTETADDPMCDGSTG